MSRKFSIEDLEFLATWLDRRGDLHEAKAKELVACSTTTADQAKKSDVVSSQVAQRDKARHYAWTVREAAARLRIREKRKAFVPPTLEEVKAYAREIDWSIADAEAWYDHFCFNGWKVGGKTGALDWRAGARQGKRRSMERGTMAMRSKKPSEDHPRWKKWVAERRLSYVAQADALPYMIEAFEKWMKENP